MVTSKNQICQLALTHLGSYEDNINDIDNPLTRIETIFSIWYDTAREETLRLMMPNFATTRRIVAQRAEAPAFGYGYAYEYPSDCLRVLGFGEIDEKDKRYNVEIADDGVKEIQLDDDFSTGLKLRFVKDITDVTRFDADFVVLLSMILAKYSSLAITGRPRARGDMDALAKMHMLQVSGTSAQENPPVRLSTSKFKQAKYSDPVRNNEKR